VGFEKLKILHVNNRHRGVGGSDIYCDEVIQMCIDHDLDVRVFEKDSKQLPAGIRGKLKAFFNGIYAPSAVREFDSVIQEFQPDIVHVHELFPLISPWILPKCTKAGIPVVMTCYDFRLTCPVATHHNTKKGICYDCLGGREYKAVINNCRNSFPESTAFALRSMLARWFSLFTKNISKFIVLTEFSRQWITEKANIEPERVATIPCVVKAPPVGVDDPSIGEYVAYAGRLAPEKGVEILMGACRKAGLPLRLAANAPSYPAIRPEDDFECVLTEEPGSLEAFYRGARVLVVASLWEETFACVLSEAKSHGIPVIAPKIGAMPDLIEDGKTGLLFETANEDELAVKLDQLWNNAALCRTLGYAGRCDIQQNLNEDVCFESLMQVYHDVTGGHPISSSK
jgi:glycosyltransferase involved in cell wall biosynthesis